ncbi:MAG: MaoC family dehydratase [Ilumatobacteraceae bacterium]
MNDLSYVDVSVGDEIAPLPFPLDPSFIVATAIASRDYQEVHHDPVLATARGSKDIFMNILTTNGLIGRYVTDWAGPNAVIRKVAIRLGAPNYPGDTMTVTGTVTRKQDGEIEVAVIGANNLGNHVTGTVVLTLSGSSSDGAEQ